MKFKLAAFADEADSSIDGQILAMKDERKFCFASGDSGRGRSEYRRYFKG